MINYSNSNLGMLIILLLEISNWWLVLLYFELTCRPGGFPCCRRGGRGRREDTYCIRHRTPGSLYRSGTGSRCLSSHEKIAAPDRQRTCKMSTGELSPQFSSSQLLEVIVRVSSHGCFYTAQEDRYSRSCSLYNKISVAET